MWFHLSHSDALCLCIVIRFDVNCELSATEWEDRRTKYSSRWSALKPTHGFASLFACNCAFVATQIENKDESLASAFHCPWWNLLSQSIHSAGAWVCVCVGVWECSKYKVDDGVADGQDYRITLGFLFVFNLLLLSLLAARLSVKCILYVPSTRVRYH